MKKKGNKQDIVKYPWSDIQLIKYITKCVTLIKFLIHLGHFLPKQWEQPHLIFRGFSDISYPMFNVARPLHVLRAVISVLTLLNLPSLISSPIVLIASETGDASLNSHKTSFSQGFHMLTISTKSTKKTLPGWLMR